MWFKEVASSPLNGLFVIEENDNYFCFVDLAVDNLKSLLFKMENDYSIAPIANTIQVGCVDSCNVIKAVLRYLIKISI